MFRSTGVCLSFFAWFAVHYLSHLCSWLLASRAIHSITTRPPIHSALNYYHPFAVVLSRLVRDSESLFDKPLRSHHTHHPFHCSWLTNTKDAEVESTVYNLFSFFPLSPLSLLFSFSFFSFLTLNKLLVSLFPCVAILHLNISGTD